MAQQEHNHRCGNSNSIGGGYGGNRSSRKLKQKKVPQRGLGVAQLEKILEEQEKKVVATFQPNSLVSPTNSSSCLGLGQCAAPTNFRQTPSPFPVPLPPPPPPTDVSSPNSVFRPSSYTPKTDPSHPITSLPLPSTSNDGGRGIRYPAIPGFGHGSGPRFWNYEHNLEREIHRLDQNGFAVRSNMDSPYESRPIWPPPSLIQKEHQFQQQPSSAMVNVSLGTSTSSAMEPPSNQSFYSNYYTSMWPEEDRMVGTKRTYPFSRDNQSGPCFPCKFPPTNVPPIARGDVSGSNFTGATENAEHSNPSFRESPSGSALASELYPRNLATENGGNGDMIGDFLTLATPTTAPPHSRSRHNFSLANMTPPSRELSEVECLPYQGNGDQSHEAGPSGSTTPKRPFYSFLPPAKLQTGQETEALGSHSDKLRGKLDLNLKL